MEEQQITLEGRTYHLGDFFFHMATQNPVETSESTNELPEALRERFMSMVHVPYPSLELLRKIAVRDTAKKDIKPVIDLVQTVHVRTRLYEEYVEGRESAPAIDYLARLIHWIKHTHPLTIWGPGVRASEDLATAAAVHAFLHERTHITFEDVQREALPVLRFKFKRHHSKSREAGVVSNDEIIEEALGRVPLVEAA